MKRIYLACALFLTAWAAAGQTPVIGPQNTNGAVTAGCANAYCAMFGPLNTMTYSPSFDTSGYLNFLKSIHGDFKVNGTTITTDSAAANYSTSVTPDAGYTIGNPILNGNSFGIEFPTPSSPAALQAAYGAGFIAMVKANVTTTFDHLGDGPTNLSSGTGSATAAAGTSATQPTMIKLTSGNASGNPGGYSGAGLAWFAGLPVATSYVQYPAAGDFSAVRTYVGLCRACTVSNLNADASDGGAGPVGPTAMAMINYSTVRGDAVWQCVTTSDGTTYSVKAITSATPSTTGKLMKIAVNSSSVVCTVGANSVTVSTNIPSAVAINGVMYVLSLTQAGASVNIETDGWYLYYQNRNN